MNKKIKLNEGDSITVTVDSKSDEKESTCDYLGFSKCTLEMYKCFLGVGFDKNQALELTKTIIRCGIK